MLVPVPRVGRGPATDFTVLASLVGGLLVWLVLASYALGRSQRLAVVHMQRDIATYVADELGGAVTRADADRALASRTTLRTLMTRAGLDLGDDTAIGVDATANVAHVVRVRGGNLTIVRSIDTPGMDMAPGRPELLQAFVTVALAATCLLGALLLLRLRRQHEETSARTDFVRVVSHELRTPLSQVLMFAETLRLGRTRSEAERTMALDVILQEARRLARLVDNVLRFSRSEQQGVSLRQDVVDVAADVRELAAQFAPVNHPDAPHVQVHIEGDTRALGDRDALRQIMVNLLDNAFKHGTGARRVQIGVMQQGDQVMLSVEDDGAGIHDADVERIWQPFGRAANGAHSGTGTGLGLTIVHTLVAAMQGTVQHERPEGGRGARFVVALQAVPAQLPRESRDGSLAGIAS